MKGAALFLAIALAGATAGTAGGEAERSDAVERGRDALRRGVEFLLETENPDGSWGYHAQRKPFRIFAPVPGAHRSFKVATTGLALMSLLEVAGDERLPCARRRALEFLLAHSRVKRSQGNELYNVWAYGYALQALARCVRREAFQADAERIRAKMEELVRALALYQAVDGGWGYLDFRGGAYRPSGDSMSFTTGSILIALSEAAEAGVAAPRPVLVKALRCLRRCRTREGSYLYSFYWWRYPLSPINRPAGSLTRTPCCDLALHLFDEAIGTEDLERGVKRLLEHRKFARMALHRPWPHESWCQVSGYFYLFGYFYAAECFPLMRPEIREEVRAGLIEEVLATRDRDGSFWDYPFYGYDKPYGTAYAVLALARLVP